MDDLKFISPEAFEAHLCKKPVSCVLAGRVVTFLCLLMRGHAGECMEARAVRKQKES